ncbi:MAG: efflux RND transporter permease subunit [Bacteroidales bacterium]|nr:efflux RND transporter permease subunit [Bacteroidales bacterium]
MDLGKWAFKNSKLVYFLIAVLCVGGLLATYNMSKLEDPEITVKMAVVSAVYPGTSAHDMEMQVIDPLEKAIGEMDDVEVISSTSFNDFGLITVELYKTVREEDIQQCWDMLRRKVNDCASTLPEGASVAVKDDFGAVYGMFYALTADGYSPQQMSDYAELLKRELGGIEGVGKISIYGERDNCINISLKLGKMATLGVGAIEVLNTLNTQNGVYYAGYYDNGDDRVRVAVDGKMQTVQRISDMIIQGHEFEQLRLSDIATITEGYDEPVRNSMTFNGQQALGIAIAARSGTDITKVGAAVEKRMAQLHEERFPVGIECHKVFNQADQVSSALSTFFINLLESVVIVIVILMLTMGFKSGVIIGISLVVVVIGSLMILGYMDGTMQRVSLAAFILAMGMLVDNAIVIVDGILIDLKQGKERMSALTDIGRRTAGPLLGATLIAVCSFLPVFLSPDTAGTYVHDLFVVLAVSLILSWVLALVHVPLMANSFFSKNRQSEEQAALYDGKMYVVLRKSIRFTLEHRWTSVIVAVVLVALSAWGYRFMRQGFFPDMVYDQLYMEYKLPEGTNYTRVQKDLAEIESYLHTRSEVTDVVASVGGTPARYNLVRSIADPSLSYGELIVSFTSPKALEENYEDLQQHLEQLYPDAYLKFKRYNIMYKKYPIEAVFSGPDPAVLHQLADSARAIMEKSPMVRNLYTNWAPKTPLLNIGFDQQAAHRSELNRQNVALSVLSATGGIPVGTFYDGILKNTIYMKCVDNNGETIDNLDNVPIFSTLPRIVSAIDDEALVRLSMGMIDRSEFIERLFQTVPLQQVSDGVNVNWEDPAIPRYKNRRSQSVMCSPVAGVETEAARRSIAADIEHLQLPEGYSLHWGGEREASNATMRYLFANLPLAIVLMIAILILLFKSYRKPLIILLGIPLLAPGIVGAMLLTGQTFTFCAIVGALGLIGMMMKNAIVLMDEIKDQLNAGVEPVKALIESAQSRFRPVMMASLTTILGMIPLLSDAMFGSMAAAIMGGLLFSTFATLFFIPVFYALFFKIKVKK